MSRYIDADAMKEWIDEYVSVFKKSDNKDIKGYIEHQPTIEAVPKDFHDKTCEAMAKAHQEEIADMVRIADRPQGEWIEFDTKWGRSLYYCTNCMETSEVPTAFGKPLYDFCPNCGADMREREGE